jgi:hypothetical protein
MFGRLSFLRPPLPAAVERNEFNAWLGARYDARQAITRRNLNFRTHWKWTAAIAHLWAKSRRAFHGRCLWARVILLIASRARGPGASPFQTATGATH